MKRIRAIAIYEILAGLVALRQLVEPVTIPGGTALTFNVFAVLIAGLSMCLGILLWSGRRRWVRASVTFQLLQTVRVTSSALMLGLLVGIDGSIQFSGPLMRLSTTTGLIAAVLVQRPPQETWIAVNLIALVLAVTLILAGREIQLSLTPVNNPTVRPEAITGS